MLNGVPVFAHRWTGSDRRISSTHTHSYGQLQVIVAGRVRSEVDGEIIDAGAGDVLYYPAGCRHRDTNDVEPILVIDSIGFHWSGAPPELPRLIRDRHGRLRRLAQWMAEDWHDSHSYRDECRRGAFAGIMAELLRLLDEHQPELVRTVRLKIRTHLNEPLTLEQMAGWVNMERTSFARKYRALAGMTAMQEVRRVRVSTATEHLLTTDMTLDDIASRVGLADGFTLSHLLKRETGKSPRTIRRGE